MKKAIQIILGIVIVGLSYVLIEQIMVPIRFQEDVQTRQADVIERLKDIRSAQRVFKAKHERYTSSFDTLITFILTDSIIAQKTTGSMDDSLAVAENRAKIEEYKIAAIDTVFGSRKFTPEMVQELRIIPHSAGAHYILDAGFFETESQTIVPVFECKAPYKLFLLGIGEQELINLIDSKKYLDKYPGIKVGAMDKAINDAGNWE